MIHKGMNNISYKIDHTAIQGHFTVQNFKIYKIHNTQMANVTEYE